MTAARCHSCNEPLVDEQILAIHLAAGHHIGPADTKGKNAMPEEVQFFTERRCPVTLVDVKPKLNSEKEKRIRFDFSLPLTAKILEAAPRDVKDAFYAVVKDGAHLDAVSISTEFEGVIASFFETVATKTPTLELNNCQLRKLEVSRPTSKLDLADGDVRLGFHMNVPASREAWAWAYRAFGTDLCAVFEAMQPVFPQLKAANPNGDGQAILNMEKQEVEATVAKPATKSKVEARAEAERVLGGTPGRRDATPGRRAEARGLEDQSDEEREQVNT